MSLEQSIQNLADAILVLANGRIGISDTKTTDVQPEGEQPKRGRGRPPKNPTEPSVPADAAVASTPAGEAEVAAPVAPANPSGAPAAASPMDAPNVSKEDVLAVVMKIAKLGQDGRNQCVALCAKYGAKNISGVAPTSYPALLADAQATLAKMQGA